MGERFRSGVGIVVVGADGLVVAVERSAQPGSWQLPQGGIKSGEDPEAAMWRELGEEIGLGPEDARLVATSRSWLSYELPSEMRTRKKLGMGQTQRWFLLSLQVDPGRIRPDGRELRAWRWMTLGELASTTIPFRRALYEALGAAFDTWLD